MMEIFTQLFKTLLETVGAECRNIYVKVNYSCSIWIPTYSSPVKKKKNRINSKDEHEKGICLVLMFAFLFPSTQISS